MLTRGTDIRRTGLAMCVLAGCGVVTGAAAAVYRWVDDAGRVHFSDTPPASHTEVLEFAPGTAAQAARRQQLLAEESAAAARDEACAAARTQLAQYQSAGRLVERDPDGNERELNADERASLVETAQARVDADCEVSR